ncbi:MAG: hypothetical protein ACRD0E_02140 [Acidimicrobiales bacterium]
MKIRLMAGAGVASVLAMVLLLLPSASATGSVLAATRANGMGFVTETQGAALGIHPGMGGPNGTVPVVRQLSVHSDSASGCNQEVCIYVYGQGLFVQQWNTTAYFPDGTESFAAYWANGNVIATTNSFYASPGTWYEAYWTPDEYFANNTKVCNAWFNNAGFPCETVHS